MVAFRKLFPVLAVGAFLLGTASTASAQGNPFTCQQGTSVPPVVRAEGFTELVGDIVLLCTGGVPGQPILANFNVFLNTNVTSRLVADGALSEALLLIDEPAGSSGQVVCASPNAASNSAGFPGLGAAPACNPATGGTAVQTGTYTAFRAQPAPGANGVANAALVWAGIPIIPPGTTETRIIRITNVRANATTISQSVNPVPNQIFAFIAISGSQAISINNPQQTVAFVLPGLQFSLTACNGGSSSLANFVQCIGNNPTGTGSATFGLRFTEGFQTAFKTRIATGQSSSIPGIAYNTESGFVRPETNLGSSVGEATTGTRLAARFSNIPAGVSLYVSTSNISGTTTVNPTDAAATLVSVNPSANGVASGSAPSGDGATLTCPLTSSLDASRPAAPVTLSGTGNARSGVAVWEVSSVSTSAIDTLIFLVGVSYTPNTPEDLPGLGIGSVAGSFAPFYASTSAAASASGSLPIPRFIDTATPAQAFNISRCVTNLLFPFVTNQAGFDTGIAIANTSSDPFGETGNQFQQAGTCTINYYGRTGASGAAPAAQTSTNAVASGDHIAFLLSSGGTPGIAGAPGFQGYIIATCAFQYAHGFAFITDGFGGTPRVAEGYLALVMDASVGTRTGSISETLGN